MNRIEALKATLQSRVGRDTQLVFGTQLVNAVIGFALNLILLRTLSFDDYGMYSLFSAATLLLAGCAHLGWTDSYVRFGARCADEGYFQSLRRFFFFKTLASCGFLLLPLFAVAGWVATQVYHRPEFTPYFRAATAAAFFICVFSFIQNDLRVRGDFWRYSRIQTGSNLVRLAVCTLALAMGVLTLRLTVAVHLFVPILFSTIGIVALWGRSEAVPPAVMDEARSYNRWLLLALLTVNIMGNVDSMILAYYHPNTTLAEFGAAGRLSLPVHFLVTALTATLLPRLSSAKTMSEVRSYINKLKMFLPPLAALALLFAWFAPPLLVLLAGAKYSGIIWLLRLQLFTVVIVLLCNPVGMVLYGWGRTRDLALMNLLQLLVDLVLDFWWIPSHGAMGAVAATLVVNLIGLGYIYTTVALRLRKTETA